MGKHAPINRLLFFAASQFPDAQDRQAFLEFACRDDETRRKRIEVLLEAERDAAHFFDMPTGQSLMRGEVTSDDDADGLGARIGPYELIDRLGAGGCGVVYLAQQIEPVKRMVALKIIRLGMDTRQVMARFAMERESLSLMDHPHIARVLDAGSTSSGKPYFVMELVDGEKFTDYCDRRKLKIRQRLELFILVCQAVQHAHQKGIIHRDLKPSNILVCEIQGQAVPKVIDFGIAKATAAGLLVEGTQTLADTFMGTPAYMSPEQAEGSADIDTRSDVYSLGALLCELLTGEPPLGQERFREMNLMEIRDVLRVEEPVVPSAKLRSISRERLTEIAQQRGTDLGHVMNLITGDLDWIILKAIDKDRGRRYETANGLAADVRRFLSEEPVVARPPSRGYLLKKFVKRNKTGFAIGVAAAVALLSGIAMISWLFLLEKEAKLEQARLRMDAEQARANEVLLREKAQAADMMAQAAVFVLYKDLAKADEIVRRIPDHQMPFSLEAADTLRAVADWHLSRGNWKDAADRFSQLVPVITSVDLTDTDRSSSLLLPAAAAILRWGDAAQYERLRDQAQKRFADTSNNAVIAQFGKAVLLAPAGPETLAIFGNLVSVIEEQLNSGELDDRAYLLAWRQFSVALIHFRLGHDELAREWSIKSAKTQSNTQNLVYTNDILRAMIALRSGEVAEAENLLVKPREYFEKWRTKPMEGNQVYDQWFDRVNALLLLDEADLMRKNLR